MTREEHLLVILAEECNEVAKEVSKALRFGLDDKKPKQNKTNRQKIAIEFNDLFAVIRMCIYSGILLDKEVISIEQMEAKMQKVKKYLQYSKDVGTLT